MLNIKYFMKNTTSLFNRLFATSTSNIHYENVHFIKATLKVFFSYYKNLTLFNT